MNAVMVAALLAAVPCEPFATALKPAPSVGYEAIGWTADGRLVAVFGFRFFLVDVFAKEARWIADFRSDVTNATVALRNTRTGPEGVFYGNRRLLDATGAPLAEVDATLRRDIQRWPRLEPHGYTPTRVARSKSGEWLIIGYPKHHSSDDLRVFFGRAPRLEEHRPQKLGAGLDGGSVGVMLALEGRLVHFSFYPPMLASSRLDVNVGPKRLDDFVQVSPDALPPKVRFTCLSPLPHERWWPDAPEA